MICGLKQQIINTYYNDYKFFFSKPNVQGVGLGYKYTKGICTCEPSILVFVSKKISCRCMQKNGVIPIIYKGIKTDVIETGCFNAGNCCKKIRGYKNNNSSGPYINKVRPVQSGYCVSLLNEQLAETGTLGYIATDNQQMSKTYCFLGTTVAFTDFNRAEIGSPIIQPSVDYGGRKPENTIAKLLRFIPITFSPEVPNSLVDYNIIDAAMASFVSVGQVELINPFIPEIGVPIGIKDPCVNDNIQWTGCESGHNQGMIVSESSIIKVRYEADNFAYFKDVALANGTNLMLGDLGALVCDISKNAIGLFFACSQIESISYNAMSTIGNIQNLLKATLLTVKNISY